MLDRISLEELLPLCFALHWTEEKIIVLFIAEQYLLELKEVVAIEVLTAARLLDICFRKNAFYEEYITWNPFPRVHCSLFWSHGHSA